jgi:C4-dicarboxylate-specific signal transduction histidine kinase
MEYRHRRRDGEYRWIIDHGIPRSAPGGAFAGYIGSCLDITERKRAELLLEEQRRQLTHLSRVALLGELSGALAHELNQPLTAIVSNAQAGQRFLSQDPAALSEVREILGDIVDESKRAGEVIRRLRTLMKKGESQLQPIDLNEVTSEVLELAHADFIARSVMVRRDLAPALPEVRGDRVQLQQVLLNLIVNACDAMGDREPSERTLSVVTRSDGNGMVQVSIADCGCGISAGGIEQLFEPFFTTKEHGLGLGLTICRSIVAAHGGRLWAANNPVRGATFSLALPVQGEHRS